VTLQEAFGVRDVLWITLDALRLDTAELALADGLTPNLAALVGRWERRHAPATFTLPSHQAMFAGFFPTPEAPGRHDRPVALRFPGSRSVGPGTLVLHAPTVIEGYAAAGYHTICVGGTAFFNPGTPLGRALPALFAEAVWTPRMGVTRRDASRAQVAAAVERLGRLPAERRALLFLNASATHPPTAMYVEGATRDSVRTQAAALADLDRALPPLFDVLRARGGAVGVVCADHGTCFGEDGYVGHRVAHPAVWSVPYAEVELLP
jgi:hypothetical protein